MSFVDFLTPALDLAKRAVTADEQGSLQEAYNLYVQAIEHFLIALKHEKQEKRKQLIQQKAKEIMDRTEQIKATLDKGPLKKKKAVGAGGGKKGSVDGSADDDDDESAKMKQSLESAIVKERPNVKWDDVAGLEGAKDALKEAVILPVRFPSLFTGNRKPWKGILLYGPPGTGKSYLAKAIATEAEATFFSVSSADLVSKWMGESEKLVRNLFEMARQSKPAIIFIDEIDSLCSSRGEGESDASRRIKTEFLVQMEGVGHESGGVLVLAATNLPWGLDPAMRRRFEKRIYIPLPDAQARKRMFQVHIGKTPHCLSDQDVTELAALTEGYSGSDVSTLVRAALMEPVRTCQIATHFKQLQGSSDGKLHWTPCSPSDPQAKEMTLMDVDGDQLDPPLLSKRDFEKAMLNSKPSVSTGELGVYVKWTEEFGQEA